MGAACLPFIARGVLFFCVLWTLASSMGVSVSSLDTTMTNEDTGTPTLADHSVANGTTHSVIVVRGRPRPSNQLGNPDRVSFFTPFLEGSGSLSVQFVEPFPTELHEQGDLPFGAGHPSGADKRVRLIFLGGGQFGYGQIHNETQFSHLQAACDDESEKTVMIIVDEYCVWKLLRRLPPTCLSYVARIYPFNSGSPGLESREAYIPLGPRSDFDFLAQDLVPAAVDRTTFFNLQVSPATSRRREELIRIVEQYGGRNPQLPIWSEAAGLDAAGWQTLLLDSKFTLCPGGHNAETFRLWEALEAGSIPIVSKLDYTVPLPLEPDSNGGTCGEGVASWNTVASSPFAKEVSVDTWEDLPARLDMLRSMSDEDIGRLQGDCREWYAARMQRTYRSLLDFGEGHDMFPQTGPILDVPEDAL